MQVVARGGGYIMLATAIMISVDVILRKWFSVTLRGATELSGFCFAASAAGAFGYALFERAHVRVDVVYRLMAIPLRSILDVLAALCLSAVSGLIAWHMATLFMESVELGSESSLLRLPMWIPHLACSLGLILFFVSNVYLFLRIARLLGLRDYGQIQSVAGSIQPDE